MATRKELCDSKPSPVITNNLKHNKKQNKHWHFLSMSLTALAFFADVKRKVFKIQRHSNSAPKVMLLVRKPYARKVLNLLQFYRHKLKFLDKR